MTSADIKENFSEIAARAKKAALKSGRNFDEIKIVAVSKTFDENVIKSSYNAGVRLFGESYAQEVRDKYAVVEPTILDQINIRFIGHLQSNKAKYVVPICSAIDSVDSLKLAEEINKQAIRFNKNIEIMIQVNTSGEASKFGLEPNETMELAKNLLQVSNLKLVGLMTIAGLMSDDNQTRKEFILLRNLKAEVEGRLNLKLEHLSMGMTSDFEMAIEEGATMVRIGSAIFGSRNYNQ